MEIKSSLLNDCKTFPTPCSNDLHARLLDCHDLVAVEARYHITCYNKFRKQAQEIDNSGAGRPVDDAKLNAFSSLCRWLETEGDAEIYSVKELYEQMAELDNSSDDIYSSEAF